MWNCLNLKNKLPSSKKSVKSFKMKPKSSEKKQTNSKLGTTTFAGKMTVSSSSLKKSKTKTLNLT